MVRSAITSPIKATSTGLGPAGFNRTSRAYSLMARPPVWASNWLYSSSVTLVLMDLVRKTGFTT
jgi:hypothetical protein